MESCSDARTATAVTFRRQGARIFINGMWFDAETVRLAYGSSTFAKVLHEMLVTDFLAGDDDSEAGKLVLAECSARAVSHSALPSCAGRAVVDTFMQPAVANAAGCGTPPLRQDRLSSDGGDGSCGGSPADAWRDRPAVPSGELRIDIECRWHVAEDIRAVIGDERLAAFLLRAPAQALCANDGEVRAAWLLWASQIVPVGGATASRRAASPPFCSMQATRLSPRQSVARCSCATVCARAATRGPWAASQFHQAPLSFPAPWEMAWFRALVAVRRRFRLRLRSMRGSCACGSSGRRMALRALVIRQRRSATGVSHVARLAHGLGAGAAVATAPRARGHLPSSPRGPCGDRCGCARLSPPAPRACEAVVAGRRRAVAGR